MKISRDVTVRISHFALLHQISQYMLETLSEFVG
jgi:hypothetical protein